MGSSFVSYVSQPEGRCKAVEQAMDRSVVSHRTPLSILEYIHPKLKEYLPLVKEWKCEAITFSTSPPTQATRNN